LSPLRLNAMRCVTLALAGLVACSNGGAPDGGTSAASSSGSSSSSGSTSGGTSSGSSSGATSSSSSTHGSSSGGSSSGTSTRTASTTSSTSSSSGGSSSSSGGFDGGFCDGHFGGATPEYGYCSLDTDCACPFACNPDDPPFGFSGGLGSVCEYPCTSNADCPEVFTACQGGYCAYDLCDVTKTIDGSAPNGAASGTCDSSDAGDGTCVVENDAVLGVIAVCLQGGSSTTTCSGTALRTDSSSLCVAGDVCVAGADAGSCRPGCQPNDGGACPSGLGCGAIDPSGTFQDFGACFTVAGSCLQGFPFDNEMAACSASAGCGCLPGSIDIECFPDSNIGTALNPYAVNTYCERFCSTTSDCAVPSTTCLNSWCSYDFCGRTPSGHDAGSGYDLPCDAASQADGTCLPIATTTHDPAYGLCLQGGSATSACVPAADRADPAGLCGAGNYCEQLGDGGSGCLPACNPQKGSTAACSGGLTCTGVLSGASVAFGTCE
jgi:hypothetical protein